MARQAIRGEGDKGEQAFLQLVPRSRASENAKLGDVIVKVDGVDHYVEVKECHAGAGETGTINQVRSIKFIPCVVYAPAQRCWYVLSADQLVHLAANKGRGQHTEIPFESMNFSLRSLDAQYHTKVADTGLADAVTAAIRRGVEATEERALMESLMGDIEKVKSKYIKAVRDLEA